MENKKTFKEKAAAFFSSPFNIAGTLAVIGGIMIILGQWLYGDHPNLEMSKLGIIGVVTFVSGIVYVVVLILIAIGKALWEWIGSLWFW